MAEASLADLMLFTPLEPERDRSTEKKESIAILSAIQGSKK